MINLLDNSRSQLFKFSTRTYNTNMTTTLKLSLCDCTDAYILVKGAIIVV